LPAVLHSIDCFLQQVFCCHPCPTACCGPIIPSVRTKSKAGCCDGIYDAPIQQMTPTDPFKDDPLDVPVPTVSNGRRSTSQPTAAMTPRRRTRAINVVGSGVPRVLHAPNAQPLTREARKAPVVTRKLSQVRATSDSVDLEIPNNPLR
jgi:hypothetical protein